MQFGLVTVVPICLNFATFFEDLLSLFILQTFY